MISLVNRIGIAILTISAIVALMGCSASGERELTKVSVALDWYPWANHAGLLLAEGQGYFDLHDLEVDVYTPSDPSTVLQTVGAGKDDFGISYQTDVIVARSRGIPVVSVAALVQHPLNSVMALPGSGIRTPKDLVDKKVGYPGIPNDILLVRTMVEGDDGNFDRVDLVNVGFDLVPALISGKVDAIVGAYWVHESILIKHQTGQDPIILKMEEWGVPDFYELVLVTNEETIRDRPELVRAFLGAVIKGYRDAADEPAHAVDTLVDSNPEVDRNLEEQSLGLLVPLWLEGVPAFGWQTSEKWKNFIVWMESQDDLSLPVAFSDAFTNEFIPRGN